MLALHGAYYNNNFGDLLILKLFENWIRSKASSDIVYPMVSEIEQARFKSHFPNALFGLEQSQSWKALVCAGGGYFGDPYPQSTLRLQILGTKWDKRFFEVHSRPIESCISNKIPYAIVGVEAGPLTHIFTRAKVKRLFSRAAVLSVRNIESKQFIKDTLGLSANVIVAPDTALTVSTADIPAPALEKVNRFLEPYQGMSLFGIHHPSYFMSGRPQAKLIRTGLLSALASASDMIPVLFCDQGSSDFSKQGDELAKLIESSTGHKCLSLPFIGIWETVALISQLSALVTTKLHVGIVAYALGVYCESFATHRKTPRFYRQIGRSSQSLMWNDIDQTIAREKTERALQMACSKASIIDENWHRIKKESLINHKLVYDFIDLVLK